MLESKYGRDGLTTQYIVIIGKVLAVFAVLSLIGFAVATDEVDFSVTTERPSLSDNPVVALYASESRKLESKSIL